MPELSISDKFAIELVFIAKDYLCSNDYSRDQLELQILLTISKSLYVNQLLFRDYSENSADTVHSIGGERIHDQAITYVYQVLGRRLQLARNLIDKPSNMHRLFATLCRFSVPTECWANAEIARTVGKSAIRKDETGLRTVADALARQVKSLGEDYSMESHRRRKEFGPLWLVAGQNRVEVPEEMSLFDVLEAVPKNLNPSFAESSPVRNLMIRVVKSLNERYMLLRSCGLNLNDWLENADISIQNLRDMKQLRKDAEQALRNGEVKSPIAAYRQAFDRRKLTQKKVAGNGSFHDFALTKYGSQLMQLEMVSLNEQDDGSKLDGKAVFRSVTHQKPNASIEDAVIVELDTRRKVREVLAKNQDLDDVMKFVFEEVLIGGRPLTGQLTEKALILDAAFLNVVNASTEYNKLPQTELVQTIYRNAEQIINAKLKRIDNNEPFAR